MIAIERMLIAHTKLPTKSARSIASPHNPITTFIQNRGIKKPAFAGRQKNNRPSREQFA